VKERAKKLAHAVFGEYAAYYIYATEDSSCQLPAGLTDFRVESVCRLKLESSDNPLIREQAWYAGDGSYAYAGFCEGRVAAVCFYWFGERYRERNFWPLQDNEAKLVQVFSLPEVRGRGIATALIASSCKDIFGHGFRTAYARIWHSNTPSRRAFARAGWRPLAVVIEVDPLRRKRPLRIVVRRLRGWGHP
jgi:RimJ/RimL family protein N-acetyltransferase